MEQLPNVQARTALGSCCGFRVHMLRTGCHPTNKKQTHAGKEAVGHQ